MPYKYRQLDNHASATPKSKTTKKPKETQPPKKPRGKINAGEKRDMDSQKKARDNADTSRKEYYAQRKRDSADYLIRDRDLGNGIGDTVYTPRDPYGGGRGLGMSPHGLRRGGEVNQMSSEWAGKNYRRKKKVLSYAYTPKPSKQSEKLKSKALSYANTQKPSKRSKLKSKYR